MKPRFPLPDPLDPFFAPSPRTRLAVVRAAEIRDAKLRDQAMRAAKSAALNVAEAAGRSSRADRARVFGIARGEARRWKPPRPSRSR